MNDDLDQLLVDSKFNFVQMHKFFYDSYYAFDIFPSSTPQKFEFSLYNKENGKSELLVKFDQQKELLVIVSLKDQAMCRLLMTETKLKYHLQTLDVQGFADCIVSLDKKKGRGIFSKFESILPDRINIHELNASSENTDFLKLLIDMRYAASKAPVIYQILKENPMD